MHSMWKETPSEGRSQNYKFQDEMRAKDPNEWFIINCFGNFKIKELNFRTEACKERRKKILGRGHRRSKRENEQESKPDNSNSSFHLKEK